LKGRGFELRRKLPRVITVFSPRHTELLGHVSRSGCWFCSYQGTPLQAAEKVLSRPAISPAA